MQRAERKQGAGSGTFAACLSFPKLKNRIILSRIEPGLARHKAFWAIMCSTEGLER